MDTDEKQPEPDPVRSGETPLCLHCLKPVDPLDHTCTACGGAIGQFTPNLPFENIHWQAQIWGKMWRQLWSPNLGVIAKLFRLVIIVWFVPLLLIGLVPVCWKKLRSDTSPPGPKDPDPLSGESAR